MPKATSKRSRTYESADAIKNWEQIANVNDLKGYLAAWMRDMKAWGQDVRDDILRLEAAVGAATGEVGDPPPSPRS